MFKGSIEQRRLNKQQARGVFSRACIFVWDTDLQNDEDENIGISQELFIAICRLKGVKSWDIPKIGGPSNLGYPKFEAQKKMGYPKNFPGNLLPDATRSETGMGCQNGNRHFAKRISPIKSYH